MGKLNYTTADINTRLGQAGTAYQKPVTGIPNSDIENAATWNSKQDQLVSGTNIKTINSNSILGSGNLVLDGLPDQTGKAGKYLKTNGSVASWEDGGGGVSTYSAELGTTWVKDSTANWYTQEVSVVGILSTDTPDADVDLSGCETAEEIEASLVAWGKIFKVTTSNGSITVYAGQPTESAIDISLRCIR